ERFASDDLETGTPAEIRCAWDSYHAWFGRFTGGLDEQWVIHHIEGRLFPNWVGVDQMRLVTLEDDGLVLRSKPMPYGGEPGEFLTRWERSRESSRTAGLYCAHWADRSPVAPKEAPMADTSRPRT